MKKASEYLSDLYSPSELAVSELNVQQILENADIEEQYASDIQWFVDNYRPTFFVMHRNADIYTAEIPEVFKEAFADDTFTEKQEEDLEESLAEIVERIHPAISKGRMEEDIEIEEERAVWRYLDILAKLNAVTSEKDLYSKSALQEPPIRDFVNNLTNIKRVLLEKYKDQNTDKYVSDIKAYFFWLPPEQEDKLGETI